MSDSASDAWDARRNVPRSSVPPTPTGRRWSPGSRRRSARGGSTSTSSASGGRRLRGGDHRRTGRPLADLPAGGRPPVEIVGKRAPEEVAASSATSGWPASRRRSGQARCSGTSGSTCAACGTDADRIDLYLSTVFGDIDVIVAEGVDAELRRADDVRRPQGRARAGAAAGRHPARRRPRRTVFGDLRLRSLAPGESPSRWRALLDRLAERPPPPPPSPPSRQPARYGVVRRSPPIAGRRAPPSRRAASPASAGSRSSGSCPSASA